MRTSIMLSLVALGLLSFILFFERGSLTTTEREGRKGRVLESFVRDRVSRLELQRRGVTTTLVKVAPDAKDPLDVGGFRVEAPYKAKADQSLVDNVIGALEWAEARRSLGDSSAEELKRFGFDAPRYRVSFVAGGARTGFSIGAAAPDGGGSYLKMQGSHAVYVVGSDLLEAIDHAPEDFHDKNLHEGVTVYTLDKLSLTSAGTPERALSKREGFVYLDKPFVGLASQPELTTVMNALDGMRAARYVSEIVKLEYGLEQPRFQLHLESLVYDRAVKDKKVRELLDLRAGGPCSEHAGESYLQLNAAGVYCVADAELAKLDVSAESLRERRALPLDDTAITGVALSDGTRELSLQTKDDKTQFRVTQHGREVASGVAERAAVSEWYGALRALQIEGFAPSSQSQRAQLEKSPWVATFARSKDEPAYVLHVSQPDAATALRSNEDALLTLPASARDLLTVVGARLRKKRVLDEDESQFRALTWSLPLVSGATVERIVKDQQGYVLATSGAAPVDRARVDEILRMVSKLDALRFVADTELPEQGLSAPYRTLKIEYGPDDKTAPRVHTLTVGAVSGDDGRYAKLDTDAAVFVVPNALVEKLAEPLTRQ
jgi:hypothetical protein